MELRHLRYFVAVAEELHFRRASLRLHVVQPALSKQIAALERELGVILFERTKRNVTLTDAGSTLLHDARALLASAEQTVLRTRLAASGELGLLNIAFIPPILYERLPAVVRAYRERFPEARVNLRELGNRLCIDAVLSGESHLGFVRLPHGEPSELGCIEVLDEPIMLAIPSDHPLAERDVVAVSDLRDESIILIPRQREPELHDFYLSLCAAAGFSARLIHEADRTHVAMGLVAAGLGIGFVSASASRVSYPRVVYRALAEPAPRMRIGMVWRLDDQAPVLRTFLTVRPWVLASKSGAPAAAGGAMDTQLSMSSGTVE